jgi:hypothetical protein
VNFEKGGACEASLQEGADLRLKVAGNCCRQIVEAAILIHDCVGAGGKLLLFWTKVRDVNRSVKKDEE